MSGELDDDDLRARLDRISAERATMKPGEYPEEQPRPDAASPSPSEMGPEEIRLENLKQMAGYSGAIASFDVQEPYHLASCDKCGWVGSTELCGTDSFGDDSDVHCPRCHASGADCGRVAEKIESLSDQVLRLTEENEALIGARNENAKLKGQRDAALARIKQMQDSNSRMAEEWSTLKARLKALEEALTGARTWHEEQDKALSKQPPTSGPNGNQWARLQHREQIDLIESAIGGDAL